MEESMNSKIIPTQSSAKSYFIKRRKLQEKYPKEAKQFFQVSNLKQHESLSSSKIALTKTITLEDSIISTNEINPEKCDSIIEKQSSDFINLKQSRIKKDYKNILSRESSSGTLLESMKKKRLKKKYVFETICDSSFNKSLVKKQFLIDDQNANVSVCSNFLPSLMKTNELHYKSIINDSRVSKFQLERNYSTLPKQNPLYKVQAQLANKFSLQKMNDYRKVWINQRKKRQYAQDLLNSSYKSKSFVYPQSQKSHLYDSSLVTKSDEKSSQITVKYNKDVDDRKQKCYWEQQLRGRKKKYVTIGQQRQSIKGLKGNGQNTLLNIKVQPICIREKRPYFGQQIYKLHQ